MPLDASGLGGDIADWVNNPDPTVAGCAGQLAGAVVTYAAGVVPATGAGVGAAIALATGVQAAFEMTSSAASASALETAFSTFATAIAVGMAGFVAVPPPAPLGFASLMSVNQVSKSAAASSWASAIDTWFRTGTAAPAPPGTVFAIWS